MIEQSLAWKKVNVEVNIRTRHVTCHVTSILKVTILQRNSSKYIKSEDYLQ